MSIRPGHHDNSLNSLEGVTCTASRRCKKCNQLVNVSRSKHHHVDQMEDAESRQPPRSIEHGKRKKNTGSGTWHRFQLREADDQASVSFVSCCPSPDKDSAVFGSLPAVTLTAYLETPPTQAD